MTIDIQNMMKHNILQLLRLEHITWRFLKFIWHVELYCVIWKVSPCNYSLNTFLHTESVSCQTYSSLIPIKYTLNKGFFFKNDLFQTKTLIHVIWSITCCTIANSYDMTVLLKVQVHYFCQDLHIINDERTKIDAS